MIEYRVVDEIPEELGYWGSLDEWEQALVRYEYNEPVAIVYIDGGEPEDFTLSRNLDDFVCELNKLASWYNRQRKG